MVLDIKPKDVSRNQPFIFCLFFFINILSLEIQTSLNQTHLPFHIILELLRLNKSSVQLFKSQLCFQTTREGQFFLLRQLLNCCQCECSLYQSHYYQFKSPMDLITITLKKGHKVTSAFHLKLIIKSNTFLKIQAAFIYF